MSTRTVTVHARCTMPGCGRILHSLREAESGQCSSCWVKSLNPATRTTLNKLISVAFKPSTDEEKDKAVDEAMAALKKDGLMHEQGQAAGMAWSDIAESAYKAYSASMQHNGCGQPAWLALPPAVRVAWEAAVRQAGYCLHLEGNPNPPDESRWAGWIPPR